MSGIETTKTPLAASKATLRPPGTREEAPVRWPSAATSGGAAYVSYPLPKDGAEGTGTGTEG